MARAVLSVMLSFALYLVVWIVVKPVFATIDDARLLYVYAGYATGTPEPVYLFSNTLWSSVVAALYTIAPFVPWYAVYHFASILLLSSVLVYYLLSWGIGGKRRMLVSLLLYFVFFFSTMAVPSSLIHFEAAACFIGVSGNIILYFTDFCACRRKFVPRIALALILLLLCHVQEKNTFYVEACLFVAIVLLKVLQLWSKRLLCDPTRCGKAAFVRIVCACVVLVACVFGASTVHQTIRSANGWDDYMEYNPYRVSFWDYPHVSYADNPDLFESLGWDEEFYDLVTDKMYFMDERFSKESLAQIVKPFTRAVPSITPESIKGAFEKISSLMRSEPTVISQVALVFLLAVYAIRQFSRTKPTATRSLLTAFLLCWIALACFLVFYLALRGRLPLRAWDAVLVPTIAIGICYFLAVSGAFVEERPKHQRTSTCDSFPLVAFSFCLFLAVGSFVYGFPDYKAAISSRHECNRILAQVESYAASHPDDIFVTDIHYQNYNPFTLKTGDKPTNIVTWGSSYLRTPVYFQQLAKNGRETLSSEDMTDDNVYYVSYSYGESTAYLFLNMLKERYNVASLKLVDQVDAKVSVLKALSFPAFSDGVQTVFGQEYVYSGGKPVIGMPSFDGIDLSLSLEGRKITIDASIYYQTDLGCVVALQDEDGKG